MRPLSLRARLLLGLVVLAAAGLVAADAATYSALRSFLIGRTDASLDAAHVSVVAALQRGGPLVGAAPGDYVQLRRLDGTILAGGFAARFGGDDDDTPVPRLPRHVELPDGEHDGDRVAYRTVGAVSGGGQYRVRISIEHQDPDQLLLVAAPLSDVDATLHRLLLVALAVTAAVLVALAGLGLWVVRLGLEPLRAIGRTAEAIADGDLSRRVDRAEPRTEVGRLGLALNAMLAQIEAAFRAREASERKLRRFVADASHELRTPLAAVRAYAELFGRGAAERPDDLARSMAGIGRETERMSVLVDDLLLLARLDEGRPLGRERVDLAEVVGEAVDAARAVDPERPLELELSEAAVTGDRDALRRIVDNLLANVRAHTPAGTAAHVRLARVDGRVELAVRDDGPGLDDEQLAHVFERFYRADESRSRASGGVGLGLSIVAAVAAAHGGSVTARSGPGEGATFLLSLPSGPDVLHFDAQ